MIECRSAEDIDALFMRELVRTLGQTAQEILIARGRLRRGHGMAKSNLAEARAYLVKTRSQLDELVRDVWGTGGVELDEALDVLALRRWVWALRLANESVALAQAALTRSKRQRVTHAMLADVQARLVRASRGIEELARRAWA